MSTVPMRNVDMVLNGRIGSAPVQLVIAKETIGTLENVVTGNGIPFPVVAYLVVLSYSRREPGCAALAALAIPVPPKLKNARRLMRLNAIVQLRDHNDMVGCARHTRCPTSSIGLLAM